MLSAGTDVWRLQQCVQPAEGCDSNVFAGLLMINAPAVVCAWILDALLGDPERWPHPVQLIGCGIRAAESWSRKRFRNLRAAGVLLGLLVPLAAFVLTAALVGLSCRAGSVLGLIAASVLIYACLATRCLSSEALAVHDLLRSGDVVHARRQLARIVGRDTHELDPAAIVRATVESVAESTVDGILAPLFYACVGGAPLAMLYKAVNTLDSMVGYNNERYRELGWFSARLDDAANFIPARCSLMLVPLACLFIMPGRALPSLATGIRDCRKSPSPNAGFPEACFAGALGLQLGGPCAYQGVASHKPAIGPGEREGRADDIRRAVRLMWCVSALGLGIFVGGGLGAARLLAYILG
ncbi:adenosylcobinamide-phosphate synthase CbiB [Thermodesulfobacteriota bacterium]